ncbi:zinc-binding dehydrogenase [Agrilactobacillus fermenti]|uniref:zinc-binding dehydrogenase n=1 Tax=Agrilactobacillus fermenti TaxID=2586909 RepID=UPI001E41B6E1|nr:zinc-binding dehydrogenase [Agrilactobacillus fermenti]MCD2256283.1 zinc-binding dehydrogenase [Agrilactobacillus fermenti]
MKALYFNTFGGADVLTYSDLPTPTIGTQDYLVKMHYIGLNFADIYRRRGNYHLEPHTPYIDGYEGVGEIVAIGSGVANNQAAIGQLILFVDVPLANAEYVVVPSNHAIFLPPEIKPELAASIGLQGLTADFLAHDLGKNQAGAKVFITGISGGVGQILSQMLIADGIDVYGAASTPQKRQLALNHGVKAVFPSRQTDWQSNWTNQFDTVYDGVGVTIPTSLKLIHQRGKVVFFGMAGGQPPKVDLVTLLNQSKSILTGDLWHFLTSFEIRQQRSHRLFQYFIDHKIKITAPTILPLADGKKGHELLESGKSTGKILFKI